MDVRVLGAVVTIQRVDDDPRLLRRGRVVQVDERLAVDGLLQDWEVLADALHREWLADGRAGRGAA
jgi:hypothetical protein